jgi:hypothetical protein
MNVLRSVSQKLMRLFDTESILRVSILRDQIERSVATDIGDTLSCTIYLLTVEWSLTFLDSGRNFWRDHHERRIPAKFHLITKPKLRPQWNSVWIPRMASRLERIST